MSQRSLTSRPLDLFYVVFFTLHIPISLLNMGQVLYPSHLVPEAIARLPKLAVESTGDFILGGVMGYPGYPPQEQFAWLVSFIRLEIFFQVPVFVLGIRGLWKDSRAIYVLLLIYGASTTTTIVPLLEAIVKAPLSSSGTGRSGPPITASQQGLLTSYGSFFLVCLFLTLDMANRVVRLVKAGSDYKGKAKVE